MPALLVVFDGVGDVRVDGKGTPLEEAEKPNIDSLAEKGALGLLSPLGRGLTPGSDTGHLSLFGYDWKKDYPGRGPLEALGLGIKLGKGDIAFRANFATVKDGKIVDRRAGRITTEEARKLAKEIERVEIDGVEFFFYPSVEHRGVVVMRGEGLSPFVSDTDTHFLGPVRKAFPLAKDKWAKRTAELINKYITVVHEILSESEVNKERRKEGKYEGNYLLLRGAGKMKDVLPFEKKHSLKAAAIAGGAVYKGVARYVGMDVLEVPGATGDKNTNLKAKGEAAKKALQKYDFVFLHIKATDSFSHDGDWEGKKKFIEKIDRELGFPFESDVIVITGDHSTPWKLKRHSGHEVPILFHGPLVRKDSCKRFDEYTAMAGGLGHILGKDVVEMIKNYMGVNPVIGN